MTTKTSISTNRAYSAAGYVWCGIVRCRGTGGQRGFTIAEILLVVAIVALVAGVSGGIWTGTYKKMLVEKAARDFVLAAKYAKITAIERQSPCKIALDTENNRFALTVYAFDSTTGQTEEVPVPERYFKEPIEFAYGVRFEDVKIAPISVEEPDLAETANTIIFSANGTAQSAVVQIGDDKNHMTISICAATGRAKVQPGTADGVLNSIIDLDEQRW